ncbi:MAG: HDOD domain-containing protein [Chitinivibrionales bacterium]
MTDLYKIIDEDKVLSLQPLGKTERMIESVLSDENSSVKDVESALKKDPVIAARVLKLANSAFTGYSASVSSLDRAVVVLGRKKIHSVVVSLSIASRFTGNIDPFFSLKDFWRHSFFTASVSEAVARYMRKYEYIDESEVFSAGLLHDIGKLLLSLCCDECLEEAHQRSRREKVPFFRAEAEGASHAEAGAYLLRRWKLPENLYKVVKDHHRVISQKEKYCKEIAVVHISDAMVHISGIDTYKNEIAPEINNNVFDIIDMSPERLSEIAKCIMEKEAIDII